jgi:hypothetical protein
MKTYDDAITISPGAFLTRAEISALIVKHENTLMKFSNEPFKVEELIDEAALYN